MLPAWLQQHITNLASKNVLRAVFMGICDVLSCGMQPLPFWESPTSFHLPPPSAPATAAPIIPPAAPLPIPMPTQRGFNGPTSVANGVIASAAASIVSGGSPADNVREYPRSLPIVLSPFLSSDEEDNEGSDEAEAEGGVRAAAAKPVRIVDEEAKPSMSLGCNGGSLTPRRLASRNSFSRTRSSSFNSSCVGGFSLTHLCTYFCCTCYKVHVIRCVLTAFLATQDPDSGKEWLHKRCMNESFCMYIYTGLRFSPHQQTIRG